MRSRILLLFVLALLCAGGASYLVLQKMQHMSQPAPVVVAKTEPILIATRNLPTGSVLAAADVRVMEWPAESWPVGGLAPNSIAFGETVVKLPIAQNTPIIDTQIAQKGLGGSLAYVLPPGRVATTIAVTDITGVAGHVGPGNFVDVLFTHEADLGIEAGYGDSSNVPRSVTETLLVHIKVLAVDQRINDINPEIALVTTVTLEVSPKEAEILVLAEAVGQLALALNSAAEPTAADLLQVVDVRRGVVPSFTTDGELSAVFAPVGADPVDQDQTQPVAHTVFVFRGSAVQEVSLPAGMGAAGKAGRQGGEGPGSELLEASGPSRNAGNGTAQGDGDQGDADRDDADRDDADEPALSPQPAAAGSTAGEAPPQSLLPATLDLRGGSS